MKEYIDKNKLLDTLNIQRKYLIEKNTIYDHYTSGFDDCCDMVEDFEELEDVAHVLKNATTLTPPNEPLTPCDMCMFSPPSSGDGKPCCMCPAVSRQSEE